jgi:hypothetical protein
METIPTPETTPTPEAPKKKNFGSILLIVFLIGVITYFGGRYTLDLINNTAPAIDSTSTYVDSTNAFVDTNKSVVLFDSVAKADTTKK